MEGREEVRHARRQGRGETLSQGGWVDPRVEAESEDEGVAQQVGGKRGGRPALTQVGGINPAALPDALRSIEAWLEQRL